MEREGNDAEDAHDEEHAPLVLLRALEVGSAAVEPRADAPVVQRVRPEEFDGEVQRFLELVVHLRGLHGEVKGLGMGGMLVRSREEAF